MNFNGFQKLTLLDYPGHVACTLFTAGCNFRCPFCHNASLVTHIGDSEHYSEEFVLDYLSKRKGIIDGVCITGGEPLLHDGLKDFIKKVKDMDYLVKLDTNGYLPDRLISLVDNGLVDYVAMDIKNSKEKYVLSAGIDSLDITQIEKSVSFLLENHVEYEFRTTVVNELHTLRDIESAAEWISGAQKYFLQSFTDSGDLICDNLSAVETQTIKMMQEVASKYVKNVEIRGI